MSILKKLAFALSALILIGAGFIWWVSRGDTAELSVDQVSGVAPDLEAPNPETIPTVNIATPIGWSDGDAPYPAEGLSVSRFAEDLNHPRVLQALPNGDIIVALTGSPKSEEGGFMAWIADMLMSQAGAKGDSANQIVLLRDVDGDGAADVRHIIADQSNGLDSPSGLGWHDGTLFVANHNALLAYKYSLGSERVAGEAQKLMDLPPGGGHWVRNLEVNSEGTLIYIAVGSVSNIGERGMEVEEGRAMIWEYNLETSRQRKFAVGLRNPNGLAFSPWSGELWTTVNERDMLGSDLVPDYLTNVPVGAQYGWPWVYWRDNVDTRVKAPRPAYLAEYARAPEYALGPHVAALGLVFSQKGHRMGEQFSNGAFIARHGSWNRKPASGYDLVYVAFDDLGNPQGKPISVLSGFLKEDGTTKGRPTWVEWAADGALLLSDDTAGIIWRVHDPEAAPGPEIVRLDMDPVGAGPEVRGEARATFNDEDFAREIPVG